MARPPIPTAPKKYFPEPPRHIDIIQKARPAETPKLPTEKPTAGKGPPLFIKIDKYRDVVNSLYKLKSYSLSLRDALDALADVEKELQKGLSITHQALDKFNTTIASLDSKITRISPQEVSGSGTETEEMEDYVKELHDQMDKIRRDLKSVSF